MLDEDKLLDGLKELYHTRETKSDLYGSILWNLAKGTWDICAEEKEEEVEEEPIKKCCGCVNWNFSPSYNNWCKECQKYTSSGSCCDKWESI